MVAVVIEELAELTTKRFQKLLCQDWMPGWTLRPGEHTQFIGQLVVALGRNPQAELHKIEALGAGQFNLLSPDRLARIGLRERRRKAPVEHATHLKRLTVQAQLLAEDFNRAKASPGRNAVAVLATQSDL